MQLITPPTDNLYKFLAITGVVLFVTSFVVPKQAEYALRDKRFRRIAETAKAKADYEIWVGAEKRLEWEQKGVNTRYELLKQYMNQHPREQTPDDVANKIMEQAIDAERRTLDFWKNREKNAQLAGVADQGIGLIKSLDAEIQFWDSEATNTKLLFQGCFWAGITISTLGFIGWWYKYQRPQDELMQIELAAKRQEAKKSIANDVAGSV